MWPVTVTGRDIMAPQDHVTENTRRDVPSWNLWKSVSLSKITFLVPKSFGVSLGSHESTEEAPNRKPSTARRPTRRIEVLGKYWCTFGLCSPKKNVNQSSRRNISLPEIQYFGKNNASINISCCRELQMSWNLISLHFLHFRSLLTSAPPTERKKLLEDTTVKIMFLSVIQDCGEIRFCWQQIRSLRKSYAKIP